jgi:hypothetical protein
MDRGNTLNLVSSPLQKDLMITRGTFAEACITSVKNKFEKLGASYTSLLLLATELDCNPYRDESR